MSLFKWSQTAASNATADGSINWAEGQAPSSVNDSARAMMAAVAKYRDDTAGSITTGGTSTAYTVATSQVFTTLALMNGACIAFAPHTDCGNTVTLNVDGLGAKPLRPRANTELTAHDITQSEPCVVVYNNSDAVFYLTNFRQQSFATGTVMLFQQTAAPTGWTKLVVLNDYALRVTTGTVSSGGSTAFSTVFARTSTDSFTLTTNEMPSHNHTASDSGHTHSTGFTVTGGGTIGFAAGGSGTSTTTGSGTASISVGSTGSGGGHSHAIDTRVLFVDVILASKS